jgi:hypothetical protein
MDSGEAKEFDSPFSLLQDPKSIFSSLVDSSGKESARNLRKLAKMSAQKDLKENLEEEY